MKNKEHSTYQQIVTDQQKINVQEDNIAEKTFKEKLNLFFCQSNNHSQPPTTKKLIKKTITNILIILCIILFLKLSFLMYTIIVVIFVLIRSTLQIKYKWPCIRKPYFRHPKQFCYSIIFAFIIIFVYLTIRRYQIKSHILQYQYQVPNFTNHFYRIANPQAFYQIHIIQFQQKFNEYQLLKKSFKNNIKMSLTQAQRQLKKQPIQNVSTSKITTWSSDPLRFNFLIKYWEYSQIHAQAPQFICLVESDFVFDQTFFMQQISRIQNFSIIHVQHNWKNKTHEKYNIGLVCVHKNPDIFTKMWVRFMRYLHEQSYRRLLLYSILFNLVPNRIVYKWQDYGCLSYEEYQSGKKCKYFHFTTRKISTSKRAVNNVKIDIILLLKYQMAKMSFRNQNDSLT